MPITRRSSWRSSVSLLCGVLLIPLVNTAASAKTSPKPVTSTTEVKTLPRPWSLGASVSTEIGYYYATDVKIGAMVERRLLHSRLALTGLLLVSLGGSIVALQPSLQVGVRFQPSRRMTIMPALRLGYALVHEGLPHGWRTAHDLVATGVCEFRFVLSPSLRLGVTPFAVTFYWPNPWGLVLEPQVVLLVNF